MAPTFREAMVSDLGNVRRKLDAAVSRMDDFTGRPPSSREMMDMRNLANQVSPLFEALEMGSAPGPMPTERPESYRARVFEKLQGFCENKTLRGVNLHRMSRTDDVGFAHLAREIAKDAQRTADDPNQGSFSDPHKLRAVKETDQSGRTWTIFKGNPMTWMSQFMLPQQCVTAVFGRDGRRLR